MLEVIQKRFAGIKALNPEYIAPTHCTEPHRIGRRIE